MKLLCQLGFMVWIPAIAAGAGLNPKVDFTRDVQPLLQQHCVKCHGPEEQNGGIRYDDRKGALAAGDSGVMAIVPGDPGQSGVLQRTTSSNPEERMPPKGPPLAAAEVETLRRWIAEGADWPNGAGEVPPPPAESHSKKSASTHWSFQPLRVVDPPEGAGGSWAWNPVDQFIAAARDSKGLPPAPDADPATLLRRVHFDLTGLPPTAEAAAEFHSLNGEDGSVRRKITAVVDQLLETRQYGERWGRHWLDWVRYADTAGDNSDFPIPQVWLYRDYVIRAFQKDLPYDRFLTEQLAGDLLPAADQEEKNRQVIATGYLAMARRFGSLVETYPQHLTIEDTIDNLGRTVLGLTLSCARCHDHKFDPVSTRDYYGLYGIFESTRYPFPGIELFQTQWNFVPLVPSGEVKEKLGNHGEEIARRTDELRRKMEAVKAKSLDNARRAPSADVEEQRRLKAELTGLLGQARSAGERLAEYLKKLPEIPTAYAVQDDVPVNARVQLKGEPDRPGAEVPRKFPDVLGGWTLEEAAAKKSSGRLELARWITSPQNPLTARVIVNRVWQRHFGKGLVASTSDFGLRGEAPTHPELLDWLAQDLITHGWSLKRLHRLILNSHTWHLSSRSQTANETVDPGNQWYWKFNRQRLDAESLRDTLLMLGGTLDLSPQTEPYPIPPSRDWEYTQHHPFKEEYPSPKRTVYQMSRRLTAQPWLQTFDGPDPNVCTSARGTSVTALQALFFVNDGVIHEQARRLSTRIADATSAVGGCGDGETLDQLFLLALSRKPEAEERRQFLDHLQKIRPGTAHEAEAWASLIRVIFRLNAFLYLD